MNKSCCFIGHRKINLTKQLETQLHKVIESLIVHYKVNVFLFGSKSQFNDICHAVVTSLKEKYPWIKRIAYTCQSESCILEKEKEKWKELYTTVLSKDIPLLCMEEEYHYPAKYKAGKASYVERNYAMIDHSQYCIFYYDPSYTIPMRQNSKNKNALFRPSSGTQLAYQYAVKKKKILLNLFHNESIMINIFE